MKGKGSVTVKKLGEMLDASLGKKSKVPLNKAGLTPEQIALAKAMGMDGIPQAPRIMYWDVYVLHNASHIRSMCAFCNQQAKVFVNAVHDKKAVKWTGCWMCFLKKDTATCATLEFCAGDVVGTVTTHGMIHCECGAKPNKILFKVTTGATPNLELSKVADQVLPASNTARPNQVTWAGCSSCFLEYVREKWGNGGTNWVGKDLDNG